MTIALDPYEKAILSALQKNARLTMQELAAAAGLSVSPCWRRMKSMEEVGVIRSYTALVSPRKLGLSECVFANVTLERHVDGVVERFEAAVRDWPEVLDCFAVTGDADYILRIVAPSTQAYGEFLSRRLFKVPGVAHVRSNVSLREVKSDTPIPLDHLP